MNILDEISVFVNMQSILDNNVNIFRFFYKNLKKSLTSFFDCGINNRQVTGETPDRKGGAPKGQVPTSRNETLRQKDCNFVQSWKDPGDQPGHRRG